MAAAACSPNPQKRFDASCANDLECMGWYVADVCEDGLNTEFGFFISGKGMVAGPHVTLPNGEYETGTIKCQTGEAVCLGARAGEAKWGIGMDGRGYCANCCGQCNGISYMFQLACNPGPAIYN